MIAATPLASTAGPGRTSDVAGAGEWFPSQHPALEFVARKRPRTQGVTAVVYPRGEFRKIGPRRWIETSRRANYQFREVGDDGRMITLFDRSRGIFVYINLRREKILWAPDGEEPRDLYPIVDVVRDRGDDEDFPQEPAVPKMAAYTCDEGIPMIVRFDMRGDRSRALVSIDGAPDLQLRQIPSASGVKFSNGLYTVLIKGPNATLEYDNNTDICTGRR